MTSYNIPDTEGKRGNVHFDGFRFFDTGGRLEGFTRGQTFRAVVTVDETEYKPWRVVIGVFATGTYAPILTLGYDSKKEALEQAEVELAN